MAKKIPLRQCVGCAEMMGKKEMIRVLKTAEGDICLDATGKKKTEEAHIYAGTGNACRRPEKIKDLSVLLK